MKPVSGTARGFLSGVMGGGAADKRRAPPRRARERPEDREEEGMVRYSGSVSRSREGSERRGVEAAKAAGAAAGFAVTNAAANLLRFTGTAIATFATTITEQMERNAQQAAEEAAAQKRSAAAYLESLQALTPPLNGSSTWEEGRRLIPEEPEFLQLSVARREQVFNAYIEVLAKAEAASRAKALAAFQGLMLQAQVGAETEWEDFEDEFGDDERFMALPFEAERRAAFDTFVGQLQAARASAERREAAAAEQAARAAAAAAQRLAEVKAAKARGAARLSLKLSKGEAGEASFRQLLQDQEAMVASGAPYAQVKRMLWADPRFDSVPEYRRKQLYAEFVALLEEAGVMAALPESLAAMQEPAPEPEPEAYTEAPAVVQEAGGEDLDFLRREQARLKEEYDRMEAKLRSMEARLQPGAGEEAEGSSSVIAAANEPLPYMFEGELAELNHTLSVNGSTLNDN